MSHARLLRRFLFHSFNNPFYIYTIIAIHIPNYQYVLISIRNNQMKVKYLRKQLSIKY